MLRLFLVAALLALASSASLLVLPPLAGSTVRSSAGAPGSQSPIKLDVEAQGPVALHVLVANEDGEAVAETVTKPLFAFRVEQGKVTQAQIMECRQFTETRQHGDFSYPVVTLHCGEVTLVLSGVDLTTHN